MCGRYVASMPSAVLADHLLVDDVRTEALEPNYNVAPTDPVYAVAENREGTRILGSYRWGLVPSWAKDPGVGARMINARAETVATKFGKALERRRCLLPADGFYEWEQREIGGKTVKQPWFISRADGAPMVFAGLWEVWWPAGADRDVDEPLRTCSVITTEANEVVRPIHDRMPVVLDPQVWERWLDRSLTDPGELGAMLRPADPRSIERREVSTRVNSVRNNGPELLLSP